MSTEAGRTCKFKACAPFRENMRKEPLVIIQRKILSVQTSLVSSGLIHISSLGTWKSGYCRDTVFDLADWRGLACSGIHSGKLGSTESLDSASWSCYGPSTLFALLANYLRLWLCWGITNYYFTLGKHFKITFPVQSLKVIRTASFSTQKSDFSCLLFSQIYRMEIQWIIHMRKSG